MTSHERKPTLTAKEWAILRRRLGRLRFLFANPDTHKGRLLDRVWDLTVNMGRYTVRISTTKLRNGWVSESVILPKLCGVTSFYEARAWLLERNLIRYEGYQVAEYLINLPGMIEALEPLGAKYETEWWEQLDMLRDDLEAHYHDIEMWDEMPVQTRSKEMIKTEAQILEGRDKGKKSRERKRLHREKVPMLKERMVLPHLRDCCQELGVAYSESGPDGRIKGNIKHWLTYCARDAVDPKERLRLVARHWSALRANRITKDDGKFLVLKEAVSFFDYFNHRLLIDAFLVANLEELEAYDAYFAGIKEDTSEWP